MLKSSSFSTISLKRSRSTKKYSLPSTSPGRGLRVVTDVEKHTLFFPSIDLNTTVLLPAPDGPEMTISLPLSFISYILLNIICIFDPCRQSFRLHCGEYDVPAVHHYHGPRAAPE